MTKSSLVIFVLGLSVVLSQPLQYRVEEFDEKESTATEKPGSQDQVPALESPGSRDFTASVSGLINGLSEVAGTGAPIGPDGRVIDTSDVTIAKAKHAAAHINQKVSLARESKRSNAGTYFVAIARPNPILTYDTILY